MNPEKWNKIDLFIGMEKDPLKKYDNIFKKIEFNKFNYCFIIPESFSDLFSSFYTKVFKDSFILFPKDFQEAEELLNEYENEAENKKLWILISPCTGLEKNLKIYHDQKNIICFVGYCPIFNHRHDDNFFLYVFSKFYGIFNSSEELIENLFQLSTILYFRNKQKYEIINNNVDILELKYDTKFLININEEYKKEPIINQKFNEFFTQKMKNNQYYFTLIKSYNLLNNNIEQKNYDFLLNITGYLDNFLIKFDTLFEKRFYEAIVLKNLHLLFFYFNNYPYLYGRLTEEEIDQIFSTFKSNMEISEFKTNLISSFESLTNIICVLANEIGKDKSIIEQKEILHIFHRSLIEFNCSYSRIIQDLNVEELCKYYQVKNFMRDIDFCICLLIHNILILCRNYPLYSEIYSCIITETRFTYYKCYILHLIKDNKIPDNEQEKIFNKSIKYNDTIVIGDKNFHDLIKKINLPCKNKYYLKENEILNFFKNPKKIENKYNICKYLIIMNEKKGIEYLETIQYICNEYIIQSLIIIYVQNKNIKINKNVLLEPLKTLILTYNEKDILNYYNDHFYRLKEKNIKYIERNEFLDKEEYRTSYKFYKIGENKIIKEEDNGWDMKKKYGYKYI